MRRTMSKKTTRNGKERFRIPPDVIARANEDADDGVKIMLTPAAVVSAMCSADKALNGDSNDAEHDALYALREWLSEIFEDPSRRKMLKT
jgi:hypothetical protein